MASRGRLGKYKLFPPPPPGLVPKRSIVVGGVTFGCRLPLFPGSIGRVGLTTARICILLSLHALFELELLLCFKIPGLGRVPIHLTCVKKKENNYIFFEIINITITTYILY